MLKIASKYASDHAIGRAVKRAAANVKDCPRVLDPDKIAARRSELMLTQAQVAAAIGISQPAYARMETGGRIDPRLSTAAKLAVALSVPLVGLMGGDSAARKK